MTEVPGIKLRPRRDDDRDFLARLYAGTRADEMALLDWSSEEKDAFLVMQFEAQTRHYDEHYSDAEFLIVERESRPVGRLYLQRRDDEIRIVDIALLREERGRGIGGRLLLPVLDEAAETGRVVRIHVEQNNPAISLYHRLGFRKIDDLGIYRLMEWKPGES